MIKGRSDSRLICGLVGAVCVSQFFCSGQNLILNGDFENNGASSNQYNLSNALFNSLVYNATAFGTGNEMDLMTTDSPYGLSPQSGLWKAAIHKSGYPNQGNDDAFSFTLSSTAVAGQQYALSFYAQVVGTADNPGDGPVQIGMSASPTAFGTLVFAGNPATNGWSHLAATFTAPVSGLYLTVQIDPGATPTWAHIDNFSLMAIPELTIELSNSNVVVTWPTNALGFVLQCSTNLNPSSLWSTNLPPPVVVADHNAVTNQISGPQMFFRLIRQF